ncbi:nucleoside-triphosphatase [Chakrabartyella piscis]|uniref:nucleoside-triphosphatase n=1 Tax=Chakrabartyella piscis TaxID=2918914 RepID=UPI002958BDC5|nr:nucleoside-triphosphatase [Chakrabartyella piscis]
MNEKKHIFLYGERQIGKSTIVQKVLTKLDVEMGGFYTKFDVSSDGNKILQLQSVNEEDSICGEVAKWCKTTWRVDANAFDVLGVQALTKNPSPQLYVMDECGRLEKDAKQLQECILGILDGETPVLGVLHYKNSKWKEVLRKREDILFLEATKENRNVLVERVICFLQKGTFHQTMV